MDPRPAAPTALPALAALAGLISLQTGAAFAKTIFPAVGTDGVAALRIGIAAAILLAVFRPWRSRITPRQLAPLAAYGLMLALMNLLIYRAFAHLPVGIAISIQVTGPLGVAILKSRRPIDFLWIAIAALGLLLLPLGSVTGGLNLTGVAFAMAAAVAWGGYVVIAARVSTSELRGGRAVAIGMTFAALITVPLGILHAGSALLSPHALMNGAIVAVFSSTIPFLLDLFALKRLPSQVFGILMSASPAVSAGAGTVILRENLTLTQWLGIFAIMLACTGCMLKARPRES